MLGQSLRVSSRSARCARADPGAALLAASEIAANGYPLSRRAPLADFADEDATAGSAKDRAGRRRREWEAPSIAGLVAARVLARFVL